jgi:hypothetical protein
MAILLKRPGITGVLDARDVVRRSQPGRAATGWEAIQQESDRSFPRLRSTARNKRRGPGKESSSSDRERVQ